MVSSGTAPRGFTLIELSIVLVIIGLIVGGVLVGQDLIRAAQVRATISQIEKYNTAVNSFRGKYGALPGDLNAATAAAFGFASRGQYSGQGDGNGIIEGSPCPTCSGVGFYQSTGETAMFWVDLTTANGQNINMVDGSFGTAMPATFPGGAISGPAIAQYLPAAKLGSGNYICVYTGTGGGGYVPNGIDFFGIVSINTIGVSGDVSSSPTLPVSQAYRIDSKIDDGHPTTGSVTAAYPSGAQLLWTSGVPANAANSTNPAVASSATCFDNNGNGGTTPHYSLGENSGNGPNCALSFRFQ